MRTKQTKKRYGTATKIFTKKEYQDWSDKIWKDSIEKGPEFLKNKENPFTNFMRSMTEIMQFTIWEMPELKVKDVKVSEDAPKPVMCWFD